MYPWLWFWAPQVHFPWSGNVAQQIEPDTTWFFRGIRPAAGDAAIEEQAFAVASYGTQLGLITQVLIGLAEQSKPTSPEAIAALVKLKGVFCEIQKIKADQHEAVAVEMAAKISEIQRKGGAQYAKLAEVLRPLLASLPELKKG